MTKGPDKNRGQAPDASPKSERRTASRAKVAMPVMCRYESVLDFVATQSMNISPTGVFIETETPAAVGSRIEFNFMLDDGFTLLRGTADVVRVVTAGPVNGMGVRFVDLDDAYRDLIARIIAVNNQEGRNSTLTFDFSRAATVHTMPVVQDVAPRPIAFDGRSLRVVLSPLTVSHFTQNPLLNVRSGGFFVPADEDVPLGTVFQVEILDGASRLLVTGKGKVVAKQDMHVGVRLADVDKEALARLRAEVERLASSK